TWPAMQEFFDQASSDHGPIAAFGVASFGPIDIDPASSAYGTFTTTPKPGWSGARFHDALARFGAPIIVDTDVNGAAIGEWQAGAGQGCRTLGYTTIGTGVGTGVLRDGRSLMGISHFESGHIVPPHDRTADPFPGICPYHGDCIEGLACGPAIERRWGRSLDQLVDEPGALALIADYIAHLASTLVLLHMPDRLIFGGGVMKAPGLIQAVRKATAAKLNGYVQHPRLDEGLERYIVTPGLGDDAGITGAIELGRQALKSA
ncbi:MAG: fructokinase, partial [Novosphingobium sp.]|nr:fructokinase [Novosphingobium sp.]